MALNPFAMHVGQAKIAAAVAEGEAGVVETEEVQQGGVQVVQMNFVFDRKIAVIVRRAVTDAELHAAAGLPPRVALRIVVAAVVA